MMPTIEEAQEWYKNSDPVHDFDHVLRVYKLATRLAQLEGADTEIVQAAALLHDADNHEDPESQGCGRDDHHQASAAFAGKLLLKEGWLPERIAAVQHCIVAHRFRDQLNEPETIEAMVLFDADKLDAIGAIGVARAVAYAARANQPIYTEPSEQFVLDGLKEPGENHSAYHEFIFKLAKIKDHLYTASGKRMAEERDRFMEAFFIRLQAEISGDI
jgi:uncharacterized protein